MIHPTGSEPHGAGSEQTLFELDVPLPQADIQARARRLVGFAARAARLRRHFVLMLEGDRVGDWIRKHHPDAGTVAEVLADRYPLVIFEGDVGTGKTETAEGLADALARETETDVHLFKLSTRVRGSGRVGEMGTLVGQAFDAVVREVGRTRRAVLVIDEADSLATTREQEHSHHEDKVAVNTLIQRIDEARGLKGRLLVVLCTNRFEVLDPAVVRRAAVVEVFRRPSDKERRELFEMDLAPLGIGAADISSLVACTAPRDNRPGFTYSDLRTRLYPEAAVRAFPDDRPVTGDDFISAAEAMEPTPELSSTKGMAG